MGPDAVVGSSTWTHNNLEGPKDGCHSDGKGRPREVQPLAPRPRAPKKWSLDLNTLPRAALTWPSSHTSCPQPSRDGPCPQLLALLPGGRVVLVCPWHRTGRELNSAHQQ